ncbi:MAG: transposase [Burkholderiaceae bacterium]|nr:transposase [Burkholderiaceae bacterium]
MARLPRLTIAGFPHHAIQRGNDRRAIFVDDEDRERYLAVLREVATAAELAVHAYVLMPNHVHLLVTPRAAGDVGWALQALGRRYVRWFNDRHRRTGALFGSRYRSTVVEADRYLLACMRYIELNPVRAALTERPAEFRWSSHRHHIGMGVDPLITDHPVYWALGNTPFERQAAYVRLFEHGPSGEELATIRQSTNGGWFLGSAAAVAHFPGTRRPSALTPGRPRRM